MEGGEIRRNKRLTVFWLNMSTALHNKGFPTAHPCNKPGLQATASHASLGPRGAVRALRRTVRATGNKAKGWRHGTGSNRDAETRQGEGTGGRPGYPVQSLSDHAADPAVRGKGRPALRHGPDRRLLPFVYRARG